MENKHVHAKTHLCKGIKKPRFRNGEINRPILYAICYIKDIKLSVLADEIGVSRSMPRRWVRGQYMPNENNIEKLEIFLNTPSTVLFRQSQNPLITFCTDEEKEGYKFRKYKTVHYNVLYGLICVYGYSVRSFSGKYNLNYTKLCDFIRKKTKIDSETVSALEEIFGLDKRFLLYIVD